MRNLIRIFLLLMLLPLLVTALPNSEKALPPLQQPRPLLFIENKGQIVDQHQQPRPDIDFKMQAAGLNIFVGDGQLHYQFSKSVVASRQKADINPIPGIQDPTSNIKELTTIETYRMDVVLLGANRNATLITEERQNYFENYYLPQVGVNGATAHSYTKITYKDIYPHIDWVLYSRNNELKYDFVVHAGGNPKGIQLQYNGATKLELKDGALMAATPMGSITEAAPYSYEAATQNAVRSNYNLNGNILGFEVDDYKGELVIDPSLVWATYFGGSDTENYSYIECDKTGNLYMTGATQSTMNIATVGAFQSINKGGEDVYLVKYNQAGVLQWATYYGSILDDGGTSITIDPNLDVYLSGYSGNNNSVIDSSLSTPGAHQRLCHYSYSGLLVKFDANGKRIWGTYFSAMSIPSKFLTVCDPDGNVYYTGITSSDTGIATPGCFQPTRMALNEGFITKFNSIGKRLWGTYFGGKTNEMRYLDGFLYAGGITTRAGLATPGSHQPIIVHGNSGDDGILSKWDTAGGLIWCTYYGGGSHDNIIALDLDTSGNIYIAGSTLSTTGIATSGAFQPTLAGGMDSYLAKFTQSGSRVWGTYMGGAADDRGVGVYFNKLGKIYITGGTASATGIATTGSFHDTLMGTTDAYIAQFTRGGQRLWSSYFGGPLDETKGAGQYSHNGAITGYEDRLFISGCTVSASGIATPGSSQQSHAGGIDAFLANFIEELDVSINQPFTDTALCAGGVLQLSYNIEGAFNDGNVFTAQLSDATGSFASPVDIGSVSSLNAGNINCTIPASTAERKGYKLRIKASDPWYISSNNGGNIAIGQPILPPVATSNSPVCANREILLQANHPHADIKYKWTGPAGFSSTNQNAIVPRSTIASAGNYIVTAINAGCVANDTITVEIKPAPVITSATGNSPVCHQSKLELKAQGDVAANYSWYKDGNVYTGKDIIIDKADKTNTGKYGVSATGSNGCISDTVTTDVLVLHFEPKAGSNSMVKPGDTLKLWGENNFPDAVVRWAGPNGFTSDQQNPFIPDVDVSADGTYQFHVSLKGCSDSTTTYVMVSKLVRFEVYANPNDGNFTIEGYLNSSGAVPLVIVNDAGQVVYRDEIPAAGKHVKKTIALAGRLSNGVYTIKLIAAKEAYEVKMVISK